MDTEQAVTIPSRGVIEGGDAHSMRQANLNLILLKPQRPTTPFGSRKSTRNTVRSNYRYNQHEVTVSPSILKRHSGCRKAPKSNEYVTKIL